MTSGVLPPSSAVVALERAAWQPALLAPRPRRVDLLRLSGSWPLVPMSVQVFRNQPFEFVQRAWEPFTAYAGLDLRVVLGGYDDALTLWEADAGADACVVSMDLDRVAGDRTPEEVVGWLAERVTALRRRTTAPVVVTNWASEDERAPRVNAVLAEVLSRVPGVHVADVAALADELGADFCDDRAVELRGTRWSESAILCLARAFGTSWLPAVLSPPVKALVVDLDETLYAGVLAEDGAAGVLITEGHAALQQHLVALSRSGVFVAVSSRNVLQDVERLLAERADFPLRRGDVSVVVADWNPKANHVAGIADALNISTDSVAFLDDNPGELASVAASLPGVRTLHARDPWTSLRALRHCPGLFRFQVSADDALRVADRAAGAVRDLDLAGAADPTDYLRSLEVVLTYRVDEPGDTARIAELSTKTNQFSTTLRRSHAAALDARLRDGVISTVSVGLRDRLSDSGTVAAVVARREGTELVVEEVTVSCRALGRGVEDALLARALLLLADGATSEVRVDWVEGPRNAPALAWVRRLVSGELPGGAVRWRPEVLWRVVRDSPFRHVRGDAAADGG